MTDAAFEDAFRPLAALVVDDGPARRRIVGDMLRAMRFDVHEVADGADALALFGALRIDFVIAGWSLAGMTPAELCHQLRHRDAAHQSCILAIAPAATDPAGGDPLSFGADDVLEWPARPALLRARLAAGRRIARLHAEFRERTDSLDQTCARLDDLEALRERDLRAAGRFQAALCPATPARCGRFDISIAHDPAGSASGDLVGFQGTCRDVLSAYAIDVAGRSAASALMAARAARLLGSEGSAAGGARWDPADPAATACALNRHLFDDADCDLYLTAGLAVVDGETGDGLYCGAGHPPALILRADGGVEMLDDAGLPVGLCEEPGYRNTAFHLEPGDGLLMTSDGVAAAGPNDGPPIGAAGMADIVRTMKEPWADLPKALIATMRALAEPREPMDDASAILIRRT